MAVIHLITEGGTKGAQVKFWTEINAVVYNNRLDIIPANGIKNVKGVFETLYATLPSEDMVILDIDNPIGNKTTRSIVDNLLRLRKYPNVHVMSTICFEDTLLCFRYFKSWVYSNKFRNSAEFKTDLNVKLLNEYRTYRNRWAFSNSLVDYAVKNFHTSNEISTEKLAALLLHSVTMGVCGFHTIKGTLGKCWYCSCVNKHDCAMCTASKRLSMPIEQLCGKLHCGLVETPLRRREKILKLFSNTVFNELFSAGRKFTTNGYDSALLYMK